MDSDILMRDWWGCQVPLCLCPEGRTIHDTADRDDPWRPTIDHILPLSLGGPDTAPNKRAAHSRCNISRRDRVTDEDLEWLADLGDLPGLYERARQVKLARDEALRSARFVAQKAKDLARQQALRRSGGDAQRAYDLRRQGSPWQEIAQVMGLGRASSAYLLAQRIGPVKGIQSLNPAGEKP